MRTTLAFAFLVSLFSADGALAQSWARKMFSTTNHDFGVVARGAKAEFPFEVTNLYKEDVHIAAVRSSCGCTTPRAEKRTLKTWEKGQVVVSLNTNTFLGHKGATITVTFDRPYFAEVQLTVNSYIRGDVVFDPGEVNFGEVELGDGGETSVRISYAGRSDWKIVDVRSANPHLEVELTERSRSAGRVDYDMCVRLKPDAPAGYIEDQLTLVTDDQRMQSIPVAVHGRVLSPVTVSPASLFLGVLRPGQTITKQLVVRGKTAFRVVAVKCGDKSFEFTTSDETKKLHLIPVKFTASEEPGKVVETIEIETSLGEGASVGCVATATIVGREADDK